MEETKRCPYCGEEILAGAKKCKYCGEWLEKKKIHCPVCQEEIDEDATVCPHCHEKIQQESVQPSTTVESSTPEQESERRSARSLFTVYFWRPITCQYADFKGKTSRKAFWKFFWFYLGTIVISFALIGIMGHLITQFGVYIGAYINLLYFFITLTPCAAIVIRRLNDIGKKKYWWTYLIYLLTNPYTVISIGTSMPLEVENSVMGSYFPVASIFSAIFGIWLLVLLCKPTRHDEPNPVRCAWKAPDTIFILATVGLLCSAIIISIAGVVVGINEDKNEGVVYRYANYHSIKTWVFAQCIDTDYWESLQEDYKTYNGIPKHPQNKFAEGWQEVLDGYFFELRYNRGYISKEERLEKVIQERRKWAENVYAYRGFTTEERTEAEKITREQLFNFQKFFMNIADNEVKILDWDLDPNSQTNAYNGYLVTYEIGSGYYVLLHLLIDSNDGGYNIQIIYNGTSLSELTNHRSDYLTK